MVVGDCRVAMLAIGLWLVLGVVVVLPWQQQHGGGVMADVYMHNPRGSNDRNCERNVNRNNGNRLFDSQNNAKGGYACPRAVGDENIQAENGDVLNGIYDQNVKMFYYEGSILPIEWTNQHGCGNNSKTNCEIVLQYACEDTLDPQVADFWPYVAGKDSDTNNDVQHFRSDDDIAAPRDGIPRDDNDAATDTIPDTEDAATPDSKEDRRYGMHESYDFYQLCQYTQRNKGLYTADQNVRRNDQRGTRQNPNGNRRGLECPEERDYYPWWQPTPWIDIAVLTDEATDTPCRDEATCGTESTQRCAYYMSESMNTEKKGYCDVDHDSQSFADKEATSAWRNRVWYINQTDCEEAGFSWYKIAHSDNLNIKSPTCVRTQFSRINHLGNSKDDTVESIALNMVGDDDTDDDDERTTIWENTVQGSNANRFLWQIPTIPTADDGDDYFEGVDGNGMEDAYKSCVVRMRYNISTGDFPQWPNDAMNEGHPWYGQMVDSDDNAVSTEDDNVPLRQDPYVYIGVGDNDDQTDKFVSLAVNTNQYGRTFQDRSYTFSIKKLPTDDVSPDDDSDTPRFDYDAVTNALANGNHIYNVNVRGKRGNIVQTYPAVEYDFVPNSLALSENDMIHFQWVGSDYNPRRGCNDAEGGPPDPNTGTSSSNFNARADRSNLIFMNSMGENQPMDMLGYDYYNNSLSYDEQEEEAIDTTMDSGDMPCYDPDSGSSQDKKRCYAAIMRLAYLNQQSDQVALVFRKGTNCLTEDELDEIANKNERETHPRNCAKMNSKPYPYLNGGVMSMTNKGFFSFFSSRNNNFSNRDQTGTICVGDSCLDRIDASTGVLQAPNPALTTQAMQERNQETFASSYCNDEANNDDSANNNGAASCLGTGKDLLDGETFTVEQGDNDALGDGDKNGCEEIIFSAIGTDTVEQRVALALILLFAGIVCTWGGYYLYNRHKAKQERLPTFKGDKRWQSETRIPEAEMI